MPLVDFVRRVLGCGCPDEVFEQIETGRLESPAVVPTLRVVVGRRLLIYIHEIDGPVEAAVSELVGAGRADRDREGFNRVRIVLACDGGESAVAPRAQRQFDGLPAGLVDDKVHLHVVPLDQLPAPWKTAR